MKLTILFVVVVGATLVWWLRRVKPKLPRPRKGSPALFLIVGKPALRPRIGKGGIELSVLQSYFQSYLRNPSIGHRRVGIRPCGD